MQTVLRYGMDRAIQLDLPPDSVLAQFDGPQAAPIDQPGARLAEALNEPVELPPLFQAIAPGDRVALAVGPGIPRLAELVRPLVETILSRQVAAGDITILQTQHDARSRAEDPRSKLDPRVRDEVTLLTHDPADRSQLSYLAATADGRPIYLNRALTDADLVVSIGCEEGDPRGSCGEPVHVYPTFSDAESQRRIAAASEGGKKAGVDATRREIDEVSWLLGVLYGVRVVPGLSEQVLDVMVGDVRAVSRMARKATKAAWSCPVPRRASLVVAGISGGDRQQTWHNLGRALDAALKAMEADGAIAICCDLKAEPGPALRKVCNAQGTARPQRQIEGEPYDDGLPAHRLAKALSRGKVYLLSGLDETTVADLGMAPVDEPADIARLARRHPTCIVLADAQHAVTTTHSESPSRE